jgi:UDP-2,3-diacylglucosamine pyrophosphatase LpxH
LNYYTFFLYLSQAQLEKYERDGFTIVVLHQDTTKTALQKLPGFTSTSNANALKNNLENNKYTLNNFFSYKINDRKKAWKKKIIIRYQDHFILNSQIKSNSLIFYF